MSRGGEIIVPKFGDMTAEVIRELQEGSMFNHLAIRREQRAIAAEEDYTDRRFMKFGRLRMRITEEAYHYWGQRLGYKCWRDKSFLREYERDNPEVRIRSRPRATTVRHPGMPGRVASSQGPVILDQFGRAAENATFALGRNRTASEAGYRVASDPVLAGKQGAA